MVWIIFTSQFVFNYCICFVVDLIAFFVSGSSFSVVLTFCCLLFLFRPFFSVRLMVFREAKTGFSPNFQLVFPGSSKRRVSVEWGYERPGGGQSVD